jgi:hypothetical protein
MPPMDDHERKDAAEEQRRNVLEAISEITSKTYDRAVAYTNLVILAGFAGSFAIWNNVRDHLLLRANIVIAGLLGISLCFFVFFEIFKAVLTARQFMRTRNILVMEGTPEEFFAKLKLAKAAETKLMLLLMPVWAVSLTVCLISAVGAVIVLFYNFFALLAGLPLWP